MSSAAAESAPAAGKKQHVVKPDKPNEEQYKQDLAKAEKEHAASQEKLNSIKAQIDSRGQNKDSPNAKRQAELKSELGTIRQKQQEFKNKRQGTTNEVKRLDDVLKSKLAELKNARGRVNFKSAEDVDREIARLQKNVDAGNMKIVDEKKALAEISSLHKQKKGFAGFDQMEKDIAKLKADIAEKRKALDDPEARATSDRYEAAQKELDGLRAEASESNKNINALRDARTKAQAEQQAKYAAMKEVKDKYFQQKRAYRDYENEAYRLRRERQRQEREAHEAAKRKEVASRRLEEASAPAYQEEIHSAEGLIRYFDPTSAAVKEDAGPSKFAATAQRTVDDSGMKGKLLAKKGQDDADYFVGTGGKKGKKGKKAGGSAQAASAPAAAEGKFNLPLGVIEELSKLSISAPAGKDEVPATVEELKKKLDHWKQDQDRKTKENITKAQKEIDRLEAESKAADAGGSKDEARKPAQENQGVIDGQKSAQAEARQEREGEADAAKELKEAAIEDAEAE
ncbi:hypothetical protein BDY21DRAFT_289805 [Lineolata rhizophorae]|uniref:Nuclear segregation protein n=1 Tax=Lineolata rhizophorae TaxID=578093 RepID=A0A6A6NU57_9PEZI|nr:hypothetical protein BDY21DRAFT_289805 [Lineolata rhizophorae]